MVVHVEWTDIYTVLNMYSVHQILTNVLMRTVQCE